MGKSMDEWREARSFEEAGGAHGSGRGFAEAQAARLTAPARPINAVPMSTIAASSRSPVAGMATRCTATAAEGVLSISSGLAWPVDATGDTHNPVRPANDKAIICLRMTRFPSIVVWRTFVLSTFLRSPASHVCDSRHSAIQALCHDGRYGISDWFAVSSGCVGRLFCAVVEKMCTLMALTGSRCC